MKYEFTSESVSAGHPDKISDNISDAVATYLIDGKINHRAAIETLVTTNMVTLAGEYKSDKFDKVYIDLHWNLSSNLFLLKQMVHRSPSADVHFHLPF